MSKSVQKFHVQSWKTLALVSVFFALASQCDSQPAWVSTGPIAGVDKGVFASAVDPQGNLYVGGDFTVAGGVIANSVAKWDGRQWTALGDGFNGSVYALSHVEGRLYAGGAFSRSGQRSVWTLAQWSGTEWTTLPGTPTNEFSAFAVNEGDIYLAIFREGLRCSVSHWNGVSWTDIPGVFSDYITDLKVHNGKLYAAGYFTTIDASDIAYVAVWDGVAWKGVGRLNGAVRSLLPMGGDLYAGGFFSSADDNPASRVAKWDGAEWLPLDTGVPSDVVHLSAAGSEIIASQHQEVSKWDGTKWTDIGERFSGYVITAASQGTNLYLGGSFTERGTLNSVARLAGTNWVRVGSGVTGYIDVVFSTEEAMYAAGLVRFDDNGSNSSLPFRFHIGRWTDGHWSRLGGGFNSQIKTMAVYQGHVYAAGRFTEVGGIQANCVARWDGTNWQSLGADFNDTINAMTVFGGELYLAGRFTNTNKANCNYIMRWDGRAFSPVGEGCDGEINSMAATDDELYVAGSSFLKSWNGHVWSERDNPYGHNIILASDPSNLFVSGTFPGEEEYYNAVIKYNGVDWFVLGGAFDNPIRALACVGGVLYAGGDFTQIGDLSVSSLASWDGQAWQALESGPNNVVNSICGNGAELYLGGLFSAVGTTPSAFTVKRILSDRIKTVKTGVPAPGTNTITFNGAPGGFCRVEYSEDLRPNGWSTLGTTNISAFGTGVMLDIAPHPSMRFYRVVRQPTK